VNLTLKHINLIICYNELPGACRATLYIQAIVQTSACLKPFLRWEIVNSTNSRRGCLSRAASIRLLLRPRNQFCKLFLLAATQVRQTFLQQFLKERATSVIVFIRSIPVSAHKSFQRRPEVGLFVPVSWDTVMCVNFLATEPDRTWNSRL